MPPDTSGVVDDIQAETWASTFWKRLRTGYSNPFLTIEWARLWLDCYSVGRSFFLTEERPEGLLLLPMMAHEGVLRSLCYNAADYTGLIFAAGTSPRPVAIAAHLRRFSATQRTLLWNVADADPLVIELNAQGALRRLEETPIHLIDLEAVRASPSRWLSARSSRSQAARDFRRLLRDGATVAFNLDRERVQVDEFVSIHSSAWEARGEPGNFADPRRVRFLKGLLSSDLELLISTLRWGEKLLAYRIGFGTSDRLYSWNSGYNVEFKSRGVGSALLVGELLDLAANSNMSTYDLLRGDEPYKASFSSERTAVATFEVLS